MKVGVPQIIVPGELPLPQGFSTLHQWVVVAQGFGGSSGFWTAKAYDEDTIYS